MLLTFYLMYSEFTSRNSILFCFCHGINNKKVIVNFILQLEFISCISDFHEKKNLNCKK